jgi:hypothetical protein|tara:strand:+ start:1647 stop:2102 length:456 start_codon:yes stop_codon:yes gene_type:complete
MANNQNLKPYKKGVSGNPNGRKKGKRNKSTVIREIFNSVSLLSEVDFNQLQAKFPHITNDMDIEYLMTLVQVNNAIFKGDIRAYKVLNESLYGTSIKQAKIEPEEEEEYLDFTKLSVLELRILLKAFNGSEEEKEELIKEYKEINQANVSI